MRASEVITELGNAVYPYTETFPGEFSVALPNDKELTVSILQDSMLSNDPDRGFLEGLSIEFALDGDFYLTGTGDQFRILATVMAIVKAHLPKLAAPDDVEFVRFSADTAEPSRVRLYRRAAPKIEQILQAMPVRWRFSERTRLAVEFTWFKEDAQ